MATLFGMFPFLQKLFADGGYQRSEFTTALAKVRPHLNVEIVKRLFTLAPGEVIPWHSHSEIADEFFVVARGIAIRKKGGLFATEPARQYAR